jgi:hypothetical protein
MTRGRIAAIALGDTAWCVGLAVALVLLAAVPRPAAGEAAQVLAVQPEGVVLPSAPFPDLRPGARVGFRRADGSEGLVGEGWVLDIRDGRALVGLGPGGLVQPGDVAVLCATGPVAEGEIQGSLEALKAELAATGTESQELQATVAELDAAIEERRAAMREGACDLSPHDRRIAALGLQLQQALAQVSPAPAPDNRSENSSESAAADVAQPPAGEPSGEPSAMQTLAALVQQMLQAGRGGGRSGAAGGVPDLVKQSPEIGEPSQALLPVAPDPGQDPAARPPTEAPGAGGARPPAPPAAPPPGSVTGGGSGPTSGGPPPGASRPPVLAPGGTLIPLKPVPSPGVGAPAPSAGGTPSGSVPPPSARPAPPVTLRPAPGSGSTPGDGTRPGSSRESPPAGVAAGTPPPRLQPLPGVVARPDSGLTARLTPPPTATATVRGLVRDGEGAPVRGALILVAGRRAATDARGQFRVEEVPFGRQVLVVSAQGFARQTVSMEVSGGSVEELRVTLQRAPVVPLPRERR